MGADSEKTLAAVTVEACVTTPEEAERAARAGADRLELCRDLEVGGLTPSADLLRSTVAASGLPTHVLVRPRGDDFSVRAGEVASTLRDAEALLASGASGVVVGGLDAAGRPDPTLLGAFVDAFPDVPVTFHRAFDHAAGPLEALEALAAHGVDRVLTGGGPGTAWEGRRTLAALVHAAEGRITVMAGGAVRGDHARALVEVTGVDEVHARAEGIPGVVRALTRGEP